MNEDNIEKFRLEAEESSLTRGQALLLLVKLIDSTGPPDDTPKGEWEQASENCDYIKVGIEVMGEERGRYLTYWSILSPFGITQEEITACLPPPDGM